MYMTFDTKPQRKKLPFYKWKPLLQITPKLKLFKSGN